jgi:hypothetical protein
MAYDTTEEAAKHNSVVKMIDSTTLQVSDYGNCSLFGRIHKGNLTLCNVSTMENDGITYLKVNVK